MTLTILNEDIEKIESLLFRNGSVFDEERRIFIRSLESTDVQACPGSGKTTALLAKLLILSSKLPLPDNAGICVLTHTNTAIDEIKNRFSIQARTILQYPNFVGTIQSFIDKFLAIPSYKQKFGRNPNIISNEFYNFEIQKSRKPEIIRTITWLRDRHYIEVQNLRFSFENFVVSKSLMDETPFMNKQSDTYKVIFGHKQQVLEKGYLCFDDAYALARQFLKEFPEIMQGLRERFKYVFIDEMQDTDIHQSSILNLIFPPNKIIIQRIGDQNQAIYSKEVHEGLIWEPFKLKLINGSKRLSKPIANAIKNVGLQQQELEGDPTKLEIKPKIIFFDDANILKVIPYFIKLIIDHNLNTVVDFPVYKAIGWVGKNHSDKHTIPSYWPNFINEQKSKKTERVFLDDFITLPCGNPNASFYRASIIEGVLRFIKINGKTHPDGRNFSFVTFQKYLKEVQPNLLDELDKLLTLWITKLFKGEDIFEHVKHFLEFGLSKDAIFGFKLDKKESDHYFLHEMTNSTNTPYDEIDLSVSKDPSVIVNTVHRVKGETHTATLYMETFNGGYDINKIIHCLNPNTDKGKLSITQKQALKVVYVGMSRPTHLLCVAIHKNTLNDRDKVINHDVENLKHELQEYWDIVELTDAD